ncbi:MAG: hypothetical protein ABW060_17985 [Solirubrobacteraceae bacterium]|jgi:hypothetical protein
MTRALIAVGALLAVAFAVLGLVVYLNREEDRVAVDNVLALELTRAIGVADQDGEDVDLTRLADGDWDRVLVAVPGTAREDVSEALGSPYNGDLPFGRTGQLFVFARGNELVRFADYRGRATFTGFERPLDVVPRDRAVLAVRNGVVSPADAP